MKLRLICFLALLAVGLVLPISTQLAGAAGSWEIRMATIAPKSSKAMRILRARLLQAAQDTADAEASDARKSQVRTVDRSERIRTYNYPENRISDHRTGYKAYNLDHVLDGGLEPVIASCVEADLAARLDAIESQPT